MIIITGPSCSGKTSLAKMLTRYGCQQIITSTNRQPRPGEKHGVDYFFEPIGDTTHDLISDYSRYGVCRSTLRTQEPVCIVLDTAMVLREKLWQENVCIVRLDAPMDVLVTRRNQRKSFEDLEYELAFNVAVQRDRALDPIPYQAFFDTSLRSSDEIAQKIMEGK